MDSDLTILFAENALFVVDPTADEESKYVVKVFRRRSAAERDLANVLMLSGVAGTIKLQRDSVVGIRCEWDQ